MLNLVRENILAYPIISADKTECINQIYGLLQDESKSCYLACANPHSIQVAVQDSQFHQALINADLLVPDGVGIVLASKILKGKIKDRVTGSDIFLGLSKKLNEENVISHSYFFLGSSDETLAKIKSKIAADYPNIYFAGSYSPPFKDEFSEDDNCLMIDAINNVKPDILWVGMTAPKQEKWIYKNKDKLDVKFIGAIGAVLDFYVGNVKRSHPIFQKIGLEWLPRLIQEPRRLWRRNFISNPLFLLRVLKARLKGQLATSIQDK